MDLSLIVPCYNEESTLKTTVKKIKDYIDSVIPSMSTEILLVNDGSTDSTESIIDYLISNDHNIKKVSHPVNKGRGAALIAGFRVSIGDKVITLDADLSYDVNHIGEILEAFKQNPTTDTIVVSPYMAGGKVKGVPFKRLALSRVANWLLSGFFKPSISTVTCVVRGYKGDLIRQLPLLENRKEIHLEILRKLALKGALIKEIPGRLVWNQKKGEIRRKTNFRFGSAAKDHLLYALMIRPTRLFKYLSVFILLVGIYECINIGISLSRHFSTEAESFARNLWLALSASYHHSPHTFLIAASCLIVGIQTLSFFALIEVNKLQQEETLKHLLTLLSQRDSKS